MTTYIQDEETDRLLEEYALAQNKTKTEALRDLLRREVNKKNQTSGNGLYQDILAYVKSAPTKGQIKQADIDKLYEYLDAD